MSSNVSPALHRGRLGTVLSLGVASAVVEVDVLQSVTSPACAIRALACADFDAVLMSHVHAAHAEAIVNAFSKVADLRPLPRWLLVCPVSEKQRCRGALSSLALAQGVCCVTSEEIGERVRPRQASMLAYLDAQVLCELEGSEIEGGEFLSLAFAMYQRQAKCLVDEAFEATLAHDAAGAKGWAHTLMTAAMSLGDLHTARGARDLWFGSGTPEQLRAKADALRTTVQVGVRSLELYLGADVANANWEPSA